MEKAVWILDVKLGKTLRVRDGMACYGHSHSTDHSFPLIVPPMTIIGADEYDMVGVFDVILWPVLHVVKVVVGLHFLQLVGHGGADCVEP